jgi:bisphosphoglycerate-independent phosphoglycerate mutase (AlkP superfamily)
MSKKPVVLMILDGFGLNDRHEANATQPNTTKVNKKKQYVYLSIEAIYELPSLN